MITASLVGGQNPALVQIVVSAAPAGEAWTVTGVAGGFTWGVPGGVGVGTGAQVSLTDNRAPGNRNVVYTFTSASGVQVSSPIVIPFGGDFVLSTLDAQSSLVVGLLQGSLDTKMGVQQEKFTIPGRRRPVVRYSVTSDISGVLGLLVKVADSVAFEALLSSGAPLLWRCGTVIFDLDPVAVFSFGEPQSVGYQAGGFRVWQLPYTIVDDPFLDQALGAFSWDAFEAAWAGKTWDQFDAFMAGRTWDQFDTFDWSTV